MKKFIAAALCLVMDIDARKRSELVLQKLIHENFDYIGIIHPAQATFEFVSRRSWITFGAVGERLDYRECGGAARAMFCDEEERKRFDALISIDHVLRSLRRGGGQASETYFRTADGRTACLRLTYRWLEQPEGDILVMPIYNNIKKTTETSGNVMISKTIQA